MRTAIVIGSIVLGVLVVSAVVAVADNGRDHTGDTVRTSGWADDVCGTVGAWEGDLESIRNELQDSNFAARQNDGGSGDSVEQRVTLRSAVDRAIRATETTLQEGLERAGTPDLSDGAQASQTLQSWAQRTENNLRVAKAELKQRPDSPAAAFSALVSPVTALARSALDGRAAFRKVAALDPELADAIDGSGNCRRLMKEEP